ncbi:hypothetical protein VNI00_003792 [Paramarasmius palmivorus]|uniref:Autophagy-related protein 14 n=1 Tax=Paramarasmius palmivorus TaxID=297713 RepID=A0AAW0DNM7_9AGAR
MECKNCELFQRQFYCANCLRAHSQNFRIQTTHFASDLSEQKSKASKALATIEPNRIRRAQLAAQQARFDEVTNALARVKKECDKKRARLQTLRETLAARRRTLSAAKLLPTTPHQNQNISQNLIRMQRELNTLSSDIARARSGLVQELVEVFHVVEVGGRPSIRGNAGARGEWTIAELVLPVPGDIRRYPPDHINAVITHTIHFLTLLTFYLGPWSLNKLGVGTPWIGASRGGEHGGWAKWHTKHPLHVSSNPQQTSAAPSSSDWEPPTMISDSYTVSQPEPHAQNSFTTAITMLIYNVTYLAFTQSVDIPLAQAGEVLSNLWAVCCSPELGRRSHLTHPLLSAPTPPQFQLDFAQLLQSISSTPASRLRTLNSARRGITVPKKEERVEEEEDGWDLVEDESF